MLEIIIFKGKYNREKFIVFSEILRKKQIFHTVKLSENQSIITYKDNIRGLEKLTNQGG